VSATVAKRQAGVRCRTQPVSLPVRTDVQVTFGTVASWLADASESRAGVNIFSSIATESEEVLIMLQWLFSGMGSQHK